jgi:hypothetical protein
MLTTLRQAHALWLVLGFLLFGAVEWVASWRWRLLLRVQDIHFSLSRVFALDLMGLFFNFFMPGGTGGDVVKIFYLLKETPGKRPAALLSVLVDRLLGLVTLTVIAGIFAAANARWLLSSAVVSAYIWPALCILIGSFVFLLGAYVASSCGWVHLVPRWLPGRDLLGEVAMAYHLYGKKWRSSAQAFALSIVAHLGFIGMFYCTAQALRHDGLPSPSYGQLCTVLPLVNTLSALPISFGGLGVREGLLQIFLHELAGIRETDGVLISSAVYFLMFIWGLIGGVIYLFYRSSDHARLGEIKTEMAAFKHTIAEEEITRDADAAPGPREST